MYWLFIFIGGGLGSLSRYGVSRLISSGVEGINPKATFVSNLLSMVVLGAVLFLVGKTKPISGNLQAMLIVGFCGGFSTFSTFSYEIFEMIRQGSYLMAGLNVFMSLLLALAVLFALAKIL